MLKIIFILLFYFFSFIPRTFASEPNGKFSISYDIKYEVQETGMTKVTQVAHLKNLTSDFYPSVYTSKISDTKIQNIRGFDRLGAFKIINVDNNLKVNFNENSAGKNKVYTWTLIFETPEIAKKTGRIWEIVLPRPSDMEDIKDYNTTLIVPKSFGQAAFLKPQPVKPYVWTRDEIKNTGIFAAFGKSQYYNFRLTYHIKNQGLFSNDSEIALPPTTGYQEIYLENIEPKPFSVRVDKDGNWLAKFKLKPKSEIDVIVSGTAEVFFKPRFKNEDDLRVYLNPELYWETKDLNISSLAAELKSPLNIYNYVVSSLNYDISRVDHELVRFGARGALLNPKSALCMEFTDLFIALSRSAGIPAREVQGFAWTNNEKRQPVALRNDILHAWPEFYDRDISGWKMIDPTWEKTTGGIDYFNVLDFNHIVFSIHGLDSTRPYPAGSYKADTNTKDVLVNFSDSVPVIRDNILLTTTIPNEVISGFNHKYYINIENKGNIALKVSDMVINSDTAKANILNNDIKVLPPYGKAEIPFSLVSPGFLTSGRGIITVTVNDKKSNFEASFVPVTQKLEIIIPAISALIAVVAGGLWFAAKKTRYLSLFR